MRLTRLLSRVILLLPPVLHAQTPSIDGIVNAASQDGRLSPGCVAMITGVNLGTGDATVTVGGVTAPVIIDLGSRMNIQIPFELSAGSSSAVVQVNGLSSAPYNIQLNSYAPGLVSGAGGNDATLGTFSNPAGAFITKNNPAIPSQVVTVYATGLGATNPQVPTGQVLTGAPTATMPSVTVNGEDAKVTASALSTIAFGYYQVSFQVPADIPAGQATVVLKMGDQVSNAVLLPVGKPTPVIVNVVNSASFAAANAVAPGELIAINGGNLGDKDNLSLFPATSSEGISITLDNVPVPLFYLVPSVLRVYAVVPTEIAETGNGTMVVTNAQGTASISLRHASALPGIFRIPDPSNAKRQNAAAIFGNTAWRVVPTALAAAYGWPTNCKAGNLSPAAICGQPATFGDNIQIYVTGLGKVTPNGSTSGTPLATGAVAPANGNPLYETILKPTVTVGGVAAPVQFSGMAPGFAGLYQVNFQVPKSAPAGDDVAVVVSIPGQGSDTATISIH